MAIEVSRYTDPSVYVRQRIAPGALNIATVPVLPVVVANGSRVRRASNEAVTRGQVTGETLTVAGTSPHTATLANRGDRKISNTSLLSDGIPLADSFVSYNAATVLGTEAGTFAMVAGTNDAIALEMDGNTPITIVFTAGAGATTVAGTEVTVGDSTITALATATRAEVAAAINEALNPTDGTANAAMVALGYGAAYGAVAADETTGVSVTSPISTPLSDVRLFDPIVQTAMTTLFGSATLDAATVIRIADSVYDASAAYTLNYIAIADLIDAVANTSVSNFARIGDYAGVSTYAENTDYVVASDTLDWTNATVTGAITNATLNGIAGTGTAPPNYDVSTNDTITLSIDGLATIDIDLDGLGTPPLGYADPADPADATAAELAANINAVLSASAVYGPRYQDVADTTSVGGNTVLRLTSPNDGLSSSIAVSAPGALDGTTEVFGGTPSVTGTGKRPTIGNVYFASYDYARPATDFETFRQFFDLSSALSFTGGLAADNPLAIAVDLLFKNGAPSVGLVQVDDSSSPGSPTRLEFQDALLILEDVSVATDIIALSTDLGVQTDVQAHCEAQSSIFEKNFRRGWFGMARGTAPGDRDTPDTYVYRATQTLFMQPDSPGRGRMTLVSSPGIEGISKTIALEDGRVVKLDLDSTYLALAVVGRMASFTSPANSLVRENLTGFDIEEGDFTPWVKGERHTMAENGVTVVTFDAGRFTLLDPITTEAGNGGVISFSQISASTQKDNIVRKVIAALDSNVVGLVPTDLADFVLDIANVIENVLAAEVGDGAIGPFRDANGNARAISPDRDIQVLQNPDDPTRYDFRFFFNLRYPALRLFGEYTVDNPFETTIP